MTVACYIDHKDVLEGVRVRGSYATILRREPLAYLSVPLYTADGVDNAWHEAVLHECMMREACYVASNPMKTMQDLLHYDRVMANAGSAEEIVRLENALYQAHQTIKALKEQIK